jgi:hypothetical protein
MPDNYYTEVGETVLAELSDERLIINLFKAQWEGSE